MIQSDSKDLKNEAKEEEVSNVCQHLKTQDPRVSMLSAWKMGIQGQEELENLSFFYTFDVSSQYVGTQSLLGEWIFFRTETQMVISLRNIPTDKHCDGILPAS